MATYTGNITWDGESGKSYLVQYREHGETIWVTPSVTNPTTNFNYTINNLSSDTMYDFRVSVMCNGQPKLPVTWQATTPDTGNCPVGYTLSPDGTYCYMIETEAPTCDDPEDQVTACHFTDTQYGQFGTVFYKEGGYNTSGVPTIAPTTLNNIIIGGSYAGGIWGNNAGNTTDGRLNRTGIWKCSDQDYLGILGFTRQIEISESKVYYIGIGSDNKAKIVFNGTTIVDQNPTTIGAYFGAGDDVAFKYWHMYPVELTSGINLLEITGDNDDSIGIFGLEIYDGTETELTACVTTGDLEPYIVYSTKDVADNSNFHVANCSCSSGFTLVWDAEEEELECRQILTTEPI